MASNEAHRGTFREIVHEADFCVVGGGMAGLCAAVAAARRGAQVVLMHDRPVLGGNASSECRVHVCGADRSNGIPNMRETGILEELRLDNLAANPNRNYSVWDTVLFDKVRYQPGLTLLLNCSCLDAATRSKRIRSVTGWQTTTQTYHTVKARLFADCSGDGILAPLTGAHSRIGRESRDEFGESIAPEHMDDRTMGMTCLFQAREHDTPQPFAPPAWAHRYDSCDELPQGPGRHTWWTMGYWWIELGGEHDSIHQTEELRDELLRVTYGVWDHIKNRCPDGKDKAANWAIEWIQFLPGKRESRRFLGPHVLTQHDIEAEGRFDDVVAYGGWSMDDHHPAGFDAVKIGAPPTLFHHAPSPYGIPLRCLYSRNIPNLMFAGRNTSCTHAAMSSTRVMGTGCSMGQAVGTGAALAVREGLEPAGLQDRVPELQQQLLYDDCYLPWIPQTMPDLTMQARLEATQGDPEPVRDGTNRPVGDDTHAWSCTAGDQVMYHFGEPSPVKAVTVIVDSALDKGIALSLHQGGRMALTVPPDVLIRDFRIEGRIDDSWLTLRTIHDNHQRLVRCTLDDKLSAVRLVVDRTWGAEKSRIYAFYVE